MRLTKGSTLGAPSVYQCDTFSGECVLAGRVWLKSVGCPASAGKPPLKRGVRSSPPTHFSQTLAGQQLTHDFIHDAAIGTTF